MSRKSGPMPEARWRMLYPCRTCGEMPTVQARKGRGGGRDSAGALPGPECWFVSCDNPRCDEQACAVGPSMEDCARSWNEAQKRPRRRASDPRPGSTAEYAARFAGWRRDVGTLAPEAAPRCR